MWDEFITSRNVSNLSNVLRRATQARMRTPIHPSIEDRNGMEDWTTPVKTAPSFVPFSEDFLRNRSISSPPFPPPSPISLLKSNRTIIGNPVTLPSASASMQRREGCFYSCWAVARDSEQTDESRRDEAVFMRKPTLRDSTFGSFFHLATPCISNLN